MRDVYKLVSPQIFQRSRTFETFLSFEFVRKFVDLGHITYLVTSKDECNKLNLGYVLNVIQKT